MAGGKSLAAHHIPSLNSSIYTYALIYLVIYIPVEDLGFSKGGFCSAEECKLSSARRS